MNKTWRNRERREQKRVCIRMRKQKGSSKYNNVPIDLGIWRLVEIPEMLLDEIFVCFRESNKIDGSISVCVSSKVSDTKDFFSC